MTNDWTNTTPTCEKCGRALQVVLKQDQVCVRPCGVCSLEAKEAAYDAGFDDGYEIGRKKFH